MVAMVAMVAMVVVTQPVRLAPPRGTFDTSDALNSVPQPPPPLCRCQVPRAVKGPAGLATLW